MGFGNVTFGYRKLFALFLEGILVLLFLLPLVGVDVYSGFFPWCMRY